MFDMNKPQFSWPMADHGALVQYYEKLAQSELKRS